jgi:cytochrome c oxidase assembly protein subunit 11
VGVIVMNSQNLRTYRKMLWLAIGAFGFAFAMVPMYNIACEKVFGIKLDKSARAGANLQGVAIDAQRRVQVYFDGTVNSKLPWQFAPNQASLSVVPGKLYEASYTARNIAVYPVVGNAAPSIAPNQFSSFFTKTECFCFTEQALQAGETKVMPVRFIISPDLPRDVSTLTLSYTFFINAAATAKLAVPIAATATLVAP